MNRSDSTYFFMKRYPLPCFFMETALVLRLRWASAPFLWSYHSHPPRSEGARAAGNFGCTSCVPETGIRKGAGNSLAVALTDALPPRHLMPAGADLIFHVIENLRTGFAGQQEPGAL